MKEGKPQSIMAESNNLNCSQRRRSARLSSSPQAVDVKSDNKMAAPSVAVKRSITVRKIAPRKTVAPSENKENTPRRSECEGSQEKKKKPATNVSTPAPSPGRRGSSSAKKEKKKAAMPSPILPSTPPPPAPCRPQQPAEDPGEAVWSQKVRRSYSRLSDKSLNSPDSRDALFGFEMLKTPEVIGRVRQPRIQGLEVTGLSSFTSLLEADDCPEPDPNIPGVAVVKEKRRRRKVQHIDDTELDAMAAKMNAEFDEAEVFELTVE